jgi:hypothetical protein
MDDNTATILYIYAILMILTIILAAMKKTTWWSLLGVGIMPPYFLFVILDAIQSSGAQPEDEAEEGEQGATDEGEEEGP